MVERILSLIDLKNLQVHSNQALLECRVVLGTNRNEEGRRDP